MAIHHFTHQWDNILCSTTRHQYNKPTCLYYNNKVSIHCDDDVTVLFVLFYILEFTLVGWQMSGGLPWTM